MKHCLSFIALLSVSTTLVFAQGANQQPPVVPINSIAIVVNDEVVTRKELQDRIHMIEQRLQAEGVPMPPKAELQKQIIERFIVDRAQLQLARDTGLRVDDAMLDKAMARMAEQNKMTVQTLRDQIEKDGISYAQFRENVREDIMLQQLHEREINSKVQVSESEIDNYLLAQKTHQQNNPASKDNSEAHVRHILIKTSPTMSKEKAKQKLLEYKQRVENGSTKFEILAKEFSNDGTASKGGDLGWLRPGDVPEFDSVIGTLKDGQISDPVETQFGEHIIQLVGRKKEEVTPERERAAARQAIRARKQEEATADWMRELRGRAYVEIRNSENRL